MSLEVSAGAFYLLLKEIFSSPYSQFYPKDLFNEIKNTVLNGNENDIKKFDMMTKLYSNENYITKKKISDIYEINNREFINIMWIILHLYLFKIDKNIIMEKCCEYMENKSNFDNENEYLNYCNNIKAVMEIINVFNERIKLGYGLSYIKYHEIHVNDKSVDISTLYFELKC